MSSDLLADDLLLILWTMSYEGWRAPEVGEETFDDKRLQSTSRVRSSSERALRSRSDGALPFKIAREKVGLILGRVDADAGDPAIAKKLLQYLL